MALARGTISAAAIAAAFLILGPATALILGPPHAEAAPKPERRLPAKITRVFDGYSFQVGAGMRGALIGVTAPSRRARGGKESFDFLRNLLEGKTVQLEVDEKLVDAYGQARYYVYLEDGTQVNTLVLLRGYVRAVIKYPNVRYRKKLLDAEKFAKSFKRGIWGDEFRDPNKDDFPPAEDPFDRGPLFPRRRY